MSLEDDAKKALVEAGTNLKKDLWRPEDLAIISARAKDLVGLHKKAETATDPAKAAQYRGAARMVVENVKLLAVIRMEVTQAHLVDAIERFFLDKVIPALVVILPKLFLL